ncbi:MAG: hypothetical protein H6733_08695 [Alphaproteobacteria bacterium]|nr:hypothetical protein [Alphaproteobacteria bacterium]
MSCSPAPVPRSAATTERSTAACRATPWLLVVLAACAPPTVLNDAPRLRIVSPLEDTRINQGDALSFTVEVEDPNGDAPLQVELTDDVDGVLFTSDAIPASHTVFETFEGLSPGIHITTVVVTDGKEGGQRSDNVRFIVNGAPSAPGVTITPEAPNPSQDLTAEVTTPSSDPEGAEVGYAWAWVRDGVSVATGSGTTATLPHGRTSVGETWTARFEAYEAQGGKRLTSGASSFGEASVTVTNAAPTVPTEIRVVPTHPHPAQDVRCTASGSTDADDDPVTLVYRWSLWDGARWQIDATRTGPVLAAEATAAGDQWRCEVSGNDGVQDGDPALAEVTVRDQGASPLDADIVLRAVAAPALGPSVAAVHVDALGGVDAIAVSAPSAGQVLVFRTADVLALTAPGIPAPAWRLTSGGSFGATLLAIDDIDDDNVPDLAMCEVDANTAWALPVGGASLSAAAPVVATTGGAVSPAGASGFGTAMISTDLSNDGTPDLVISEHREGAADRVWIFLGEDLTFGATTTGNINTARVVSTFTDDWLGISLGTGGDFSGDGVDDVIIGRRTGDQGTGNDGRIGAYVYSGVALGDAEREVRTADAFVALGHYQGTTEAPNDAGAAVGFVHDLDGDLKDEPWMSVPGFGAGKGRLGIFPGGVGQFGVLDYLDDDQLLTLLGEAEGDRFGEAAMLVGDLGSDGLPELAVAAPGAAGGAGKVYVFTGQQLVDAVARGVPAELDAADAAWIVTGQPGDGLTVVGPAIDLDDDGVDDLILGTQGGFGAVHIWLSDR